MVHILLSL